MDIAAHGPLLHWRVVQETDVELTLAPPADRQCGRLRPPCVQPHHQAALHPPRGVLAERGLLPGHRRQGGRTAPVPHREQVKPEAMAPETSTSAEPRLCRALSALSTACHSLISLQGCRAALEVALTLPQGDAPQNRVVGSALRRVGSAGARMSRCASSSVTSTGITGKTWSQATAWTMRGRSRCSPTGCVCPWRPTEWPSGTPASTSTTWTSSRWAPPLLPGCLLQTVARLGPKTLTKRRSQAGCRLWRSSAVLLQATSLASK